MKDIQDLLGSIEIIGAWSQGAAHDLIPIRNNNILVVLVSP